MSRAVRITVGSVLVGVLAFVALVAGLMSVSSGWDADLLGAPADGVDARATAEVLDVDDYGDGWPTVDVRWTTADGEVVFTFVDWEWGDELPAVGDQVEVVYDDADPEYAFAADDPWLDDGTLEGAPAPEEGQDRTGEAAGWVALAALGGVVVGAVVTVVAAVRAPAPQPSAYEPGVYEAPHPHLVGAQGSAAPQAWAAPAWAGPAGQPDDPGPAVPTDQRWPHPG